MKRPFNVGDVIHSYDQFGCSIGTVTEVMDHTMLMECGGRLFEVHKKQCRHKPRKKQALKAWINPMNHTHVSVGQYVAGWMEFTRTK